MKQGYKSITTHDGAFEKRYSMNNSGWVLDHQLNKHLPKLAVLELWSGTENKKVKVDVEEIKMALFPLAEKKEEISEIQYKEPTLEEVISQMEEADEKQKYWWAKRIRIEKEIGWTGLGTAPETEEFFEAVLNANHWSMKSSELRYTKRQLERKMTA